MDRNPSPPPEILSGNEDLLPDKIGDSLYSKKWLYQTLMNIVEVCEKSHQEKTKEPNGSPHSNSVDDTNSQQNTESAENKTDMIELDSKIEEDACTLWDMSANKDVAEFLTETGVPDIILDIIEKTNSPRLLEIVIGILGNMSSYDKTCIEISQNKKILQSILQLSGTSDSPTLLQVFRVILCGVQNQTSQDLWFEAFDENSILFENLKFIFENSLSSDVLRGSLQLLYSIINEKVEYCINWGQELYLKSIIEAGKQLYLLKNVDNFFCVLSSLCQYTPNVKLLVGYWEDLSSMFNSYFLSLDEEPLPKRERLTPIGCCFDAYNYLLRSESLKKEQLVIDVEILKVMRKVACSVNSLVLDVRKDNMEIVDIQNPSVDPPRPFLRRIEERNGVQFITMMSDFEFSSWIVLGDSVVETAKLLQSYTEKETEKEILEDILNSEVVKENIGVLII